MTFFVQPSVCSFLFPIWGQRVSHACPAFLVENVPTCLCQGTKRTQQVAVKETHKKSPKENAQIISVSTFD